MDVREKMMETNANNTVLAIETATPVCSVALLNDGQQTEKRDSGRGVHSDKLFLFIDELLSEAQLSVRDLDAVLVSAGPGSYTGLRIAASGIKGLLYDQDIPCYAINTLAGMARNASLQGAHQQAQPIHAVIDARRSHLYHGRFEWNSEQGLQITQPVAVRELKEVSDTIKSDQIIIGTGIGRLDDLPEEIRILEQDKITANSLIALFNEYSDFNYPQDVISKVNVVDFDPRYYTSNQVN